MTFYSGKGMYNDALRIYEDCKKALKKELKTEPDSTTTASTKDQRKDQKPDRGVNFSNKR